MLRFRSNVYSQNGEDGIIGEILRRLNIQKGTFIEFGAWDGVHFCNSRHLVEQGWDGIFIESDNDRFKDLVKNQKDKPQIDCIHSLVGTSGQSQLDNLIETQSSKRSFDLVSIDVDGLDFFILDSQKKYLPKVIVIEVQSFLSPSQTTSIPKSIAQNNVGQPLSVMNELAKSKNYFPVAQNGNLFLVQNQQKDLFQEFSTSIPTLQNEQLQSFQDDKELMKYMCTMIRKGNAFGYKFQNPEQLQHCKTLGL